MILRLIGVVLTALTLCACSQPSGEPAAKFTSSLKKSVEAHADTQTLFSVLCIPTRPITADMRGEALAHAREADALGDHLLRASVTGGQLRALAALDWIARVDLDPENKFDLPLRTAVQRARRGGGQARLDVLGKCGRAISPEIKKGLQETGARIGSVIGDMFTADADLAALYALAALDDVTLLQLSQTRDTR